MRLLILMAIALYFLSGCAEESDGGSHTASETQECEILEVTDVEWSDGFTRETEVMLCTFGGDDCILYRYPILEQAELHCELTEWP